MPAFRARVAAGALRGVRAFREAARKVKSRAGQRARKRLVVGGNGFVASAPVFFVVGQQKSGTTWLMQMLDAHPEILCKGEGRFFGAEWRQKGLKRRNVRRPASSLSYALRDAEYLRIWIERSVWSRDEDADEHLDNLTRLAVDYFLKSELAKTGKKMVGDKSPLLTPETIAEISRIYPETKVTHIIRDGRDSAVSAAHHAWNFGRGKEDAEALAKREAYRRDPRELQEADEGIFTEEQLRKLAADWRERVARTIEDGPALLGSNYFEVRYEDLLERPYEEIGRLLEFLGVGTNERAVRRCVSAASFERLSKGRSRGEEAPESFFRKGVAGDWKNTFTGRDRQIFKEEAGDLLVDLGYEKGPDW